MSARMRRMFWWKAILLGSINVQNLLISNIFALMPKKLLNVSQWLKQFSCIGYKTADGFTKDTLDLIENPIYLQSELFVHAYIVTMNMQRLDVAGLGQIINIFCNILIKLCRMFRWLPSQINQKSSVKDAIWWRGFELKVELAKRITFYTENVLWDKSVASLRTLIIVSWR